MILGRTLCPCLSVHIHTCMAYKHIKYFYRIKTDDSHVRLLKSNVNYKHKVYKMHVIFIGRFCHIQQ